LKIDPVYPEEARKAHEEGRVLLQAVIDLDGKIAAVKVLKGLEALWPAAVKAVQQWRYKPAEKEGKPVKIVFTILVEFTLDKSPPPRNEAEEGSAEAQFNLGSKYDRGDGVPKDYAEALKWYSRAAEEDDVKAQVNLGFMYDHGRSVPQDFSKAAIWYRKAAEQGNVAAQFNLGYLYENGQGVPQDDVQAHKWFSLAASRMPASNAEDREKAIKARERVVARMTPAQVAEAEKLVLEWKPK